MVTKKQSKNCYSEKINYVFCYKQCLGVFSQAHNYRNMAITNSVPNQKKKNQNRSCANTDLYKN